MKFVKCIVGAAFIVSAGPSHAAWIATAFVSDFTIQMDNGVVYISHPQVVAPCSGGRLEIRDAVPYSAEYARRLVAAVFLAKSTAKAVRFTWNDTTAPTCVLSAVQIGS
jgi:hypothetical protein